MGTINASVRIKYEYIQMMQAVLSHACVLFNSARAARVSGDRGARRVPLTAPVGLLVEITFHVLHDGSRCALSIQQSAPHELEHLAVIARVLSLSLCVSVSRRVSSLPALCSRLCRGSVLVFSGTQRLVSAGALLSLLSSLVCSRLSSALVSALLSSLHCYRLCSRLCSASVSSLPRLRLSLVVCDFYIYITMLSKVAPTTVVS